MFCTNCGSDLAAGATFCANCGSSVSADATAPAASTAAPSAQTTQAVARKPKRTGDPAASDVFAWVLAATPAIHLAVAGLEQLQVGVLLPLISTLSVFSFGISTVLTVLDNRRAKVVSDASAILLGIFIPFVYLIIRFSKLNRGWPLFATYGVLWLAVWFLGPGRGFF